MTIKRRVGLVITFLLLLSLAIILSWAYSLDHGVPANTAMWIVAGIWGFAALLLILKDVPFIGLDELTDTHRSMGIVLANMLEKCDDTSRMFIYEQIVKEARHYPEAYAKMFRKISRARYQEFMAYCVNTREVEWDKGKTGLFQPNGERVMELAQQLKQLDRLIDALAASEPGAHADTQKIPQAILEKRRF